MKKQFGRIESFRKGIVYSSGFNIASKLLLFGQNMIIAFLFGSSAKVDVFFYAYGTISLVTQFITMLNGYVLIPESMRIRSSKGLPESMKFLNLFLYGYLLLGMIFSLFFFLFPIDIFTAISRFGLEQLTEYKTILLLSIPLFTLMIVEYFLVDLLASFRYFTVPQFAKMINSVLAILFLLAFYKILDIRSVLYGYFAGYLINIIWLVTLMRRHLKWNFRVKYYPVEKRILRNSLYAQAGNVLTIIANYFPLYLLSGFAAGAISALNYGQKIANLPTNAITQQFSPVVGIKFNELHSSKDFSTLNTILIKSSNLLFFILSAITALTLLYTTEVIRILYERGAFDSNATIASASFLSLFILAVPFISVNTMVSRIFMSGHKIKEYFWYQGLKAVTMIFLTWFMVRRIGVLGYPAAWLILNILNIPACYLMMRFHFSFVRFGSLIINFVKTGAVVSLSALPVLLFRNYTPGLSDIPAVIYGSVIFTVILLLFNLLTGVNSDVNEYLKRYSLKLFKLLNPGKKKVQ